MNVHVMRVVVDAEMLIIGGLKIPAESSAYEPMKQVVERMEGAVCVGDEMVYVFDDAGLQMFEQCVRDLFDAHDADYFVPVLAQTSKTVSSVQRYFRDSDKPEGIFKLEESMWCEVGSAAWRASISASYTVRVEEAENKLRLLISGVITDYEDNSYGDYEYEGEVGETELIFDTTQPLAEQVEKLEPREVFENTFMTACYEYEDALTVRELCQKIGLLEAVEENAA